MPGRHHVVSVKPARRRRLIGGAVALVAAATCVLLFPTGADASGSQVNADLSLSGVATKSTVLGGSEIGVHPGDTVVFRASPAPTVGLTNIPAVGDMLDSLLGSLTSPAFQVKVTFGSAFPGGGQSFTLGGPKTGACKGDYQTRAVTFGKVGTYGFHWTVQYVAPGLLGGCNAKSFNRTDLNQLAGLGIKVNATNGWSGSIVVAKSPPKPGIGIQLPSLGAHPSIPVVGQLPSVSVPGVKITAPVSVPDIKVPGGGKTTAPSSGRSHAPAPLPGGVVPVPAQVVPQGSGSGGYAGGGYVPDVLPGSVRQLAGGSGLLPVSNGGGTSSNTPAELNTTGKHRTAELASSKPSTSQLSVVLAIIAVIALSTVSAMYARLYLMRR